VREDGKTAIWDPADAVMAKAFDTPVIGWQGKWANTLRLWGAEPIRAFDLTAFNRGDYAGAAAQEALARTISRVLYPDDTTDEGKELRLKQEFFFTAASLRDILRRFSAENTDLRALPRHAAIQMNDTHPAIAGPELVRLLHDERGMPFEEAVETARDCLNYTNHTLLPEALERWSETLMGGAAAPSADHRADRCAARPRPPRAQIGHRRGRRGADGRSELHHGQQGQRGFGAAYRAGENHRLCRSARAASRPDCEPDQRRDPRRWLRGANPGCRR
jgi:glycogen phosphorylase